MIIRASLAQSSKERPLVGNGFVRQEQQQFESIESQSFTTKSPGPTSEQHMNFLTRSSVKSLLTAFCIIATASFAHAQVTGSSNGGNNLLHAIGWQTFENAGGNNNSGISDSTPDSNSTFDTTPVGSNNGGLYLTGIIGAGASNLGRAGFGQTTNNGFLNGPTFGDSAVPNGINITDVTLADGTPGSRIGPQGGSGTSAWKFRTNGNQEFGDFSITNHSDFAFRLERIHFDGRAGGANSPTNMDIIYLAGGSSNLIRVSTGTEVPDLHQITSTSFATQPSVQNISASLATSFTTPTAVRLASGDTASFRIRWTNSGNDFGESQIDNLALSGTFQDQNNGFALIDPLAVTAIPEPASGTVLLIGLTIFALRRKRD